MSTTTSRTNNMHLAIAAAKVLIALPPGSWPETQQAELQLAEVLPKNLTRAKAIELAVREYAKIHPDREIRIEAN